MSTHYTIWKEPGDFPWRFEGDEWGDTGTVATFAEAVAATVDAALGERAA